MTTYKIEYFFDFKPEELQICYFTTDKEVKDDIIKSDEIYSIRITLKSQLAAIMTNDSWELWNKHANLKQKYQIHYKILNQSNVIFNHNKYLSDDFISYIKLIETGVALMKRKSSNANIKIYNDELKKYDCKLVTNYFKCKIELDFLQHIKIKEPLEFLFNVVDVIYNVLGYDLIKEYDLLSWEFSQMDEKKKNSYIKIQDIIKNISSVISELTDIFGFHYNYSAYVSLNYYLKRVQELIYTEIGLIPEEDTQKKLEIENELIRQRKILSVLAEWNNIDRLFNILYDLDKVYNFKVLKKLDKCCIALLLIKYCPLIMEKATKPFYEFRKLICEYYGTPDVSFKENDCKDRIEEVYNEHKGFWRYDTKKNPRQH